MKVSRTEAVRQLRARAGALIESAAQAALAHLPEDVEVGHQFAIVLPLSVEEPPMPIPANEGHFFCEGEGCESNIGFVIAATEDEIRAGLERRGWGMMGGLLLCRRCRTAPRPRAS